MLKQIKFVKGKTLDSARDQQNNNNNLSKENRKSKKIRSDQQRPEEEEEDRKKEEEDGKKKETGGSAGQYYYCEICDEKFVDRSGFESHLNSIFHLFQNSSKNPPPIQKPSWGISNANIGYQMLANKMGWSENAGLGSRQEGRLYPIPTRIKK